MSFLDEEYDFVLDHEPTLEELLESVKAGREHHVSMKLTDQTIKEATLAHFASNFKAGDNDIKNLKLTIMTFAASKAATGKKREVRTIDGVPFHVGFQFPAKTLKYELNRIRTVVKSIDSDSTKMFRDNVFPMQSPSRALKLTVGVQPYPCSAIELYKDGVLVCGNGPKYRSPAQMQNFGRPANLPVCNDPVGVAHVYGDPSFELVVYIGDKTTPAATIGTLKSFMRLLLTELTDRGTALVRTTYLHKGKLEKNVVLEGDVGIYTAQSGMEIASVRKSRDALPVPYTIEYTKLLFNENTYVLPLFISAHVREHWLYAYRTVNQTESDLRRQKEYREMVNKMDTQSLRNEMEILKVSDDPHRNEYLEVMLKALSTRVGGNLTAVVPKLPQTKFEDPLVSHVVSRLKYFKEDNKKAISCMKCQKLCAHLGCSSCVPTDIYELHLQKFGKKSDLKQGGQYTGPCLVCLGLLNKDVHPEGYFPDHPYRI